MFKHHADEAVVPLPVTEMWSIMTPRRRRIRSDPRGNLAAGDHHAPPVAGDSFDTTTRSVATAGKDTMKRRFTFNTLVMVYSVVVLRRAGDMGGPGGRIPAGSEDGKTLVVPGSFTPGESNPQGVGCSPGGAG